MRIQRILNILLAVSSLAYIALFLGIAFLRMKYPFELEWMEGGHVDNVLRIIQGKKLYLAPSLDYVSFIYPPLFYYMGVPFIRIFGVSIFSLRLLSFLFTIATFGLLFHFVRKETKTPLLGLIAVGFYAASFALSGGWFDLARVDSAFLFFILLALYLLRFHETKWSAIVAGLLFFLSFLTKQSALMASVITGIGLLIYDRKRALLFLLFSLGMIGLSIIVLDRIYDGWFSYFIFISSEVPLERKMFLEFWTKDVALAVPIAMALAGWLLYELFRTGDRKQFFFYAVSTCMMNLLAWVSRVHNGGFINVLMPLHLQVAILIALALKFLESRTVIISILCIAQFLVMIYNPQKLLPAAQDRMAGEQMIQRLKAVNGDVLIPYHGFYSVMAGKQSHAHIAEVFDIIAAGDAQAASTLVQDVRKRLKAKEFAAIVLDRPWFRKDLEENYVMAGNVFDNDQVFWTITGAKLRPEWIYVPKK
ncbi:MAG: hypothetical protein C5B54_03340 [Acidobacteria bacterium]|nr:MAG: hypothetical protein C5B54_03340 [Acidobacteriota bacterium]